MRTFPSGQAAQNAFDSYVITRHFIERMLTVNEGIKRAAVAKLALPIMDA